MSDGPDMMMRTFEAQLDTIRRIGMGAKTGISDLIKSLNAVTMIEYEIENHERLDPNKPVET